MPTFSFRTLEFGVFTILWSLDVGCWSFGSPATPMILEIFLSTARVSTPLIFAALGGLMSERSGVINIALEGKMLVGAFAAPTRTLLSAQRFGDLLPAPCLIPISPW